MKTAKILLICLCFAFNTWAAPSPVVYDAGEDFSRFSNPNAPWRYLYLQTDVLGAIHEFLLSDPYSSLGSNGVPYEGWVIPGTTRGVFHNDTDQTRVTY